jgi:hypothetical protein
MKVNIEKLKEVKIDPSDAEAVLDFWHHFELHVPDYLDNALKSFVANPNVDTQDQFRGALCQAINEGKEDIFQDELFKAIRESSDKVLFNFKFHQQLEENISE